MGGGRRERGSRYTTEHRSGGLVETRGRERNVIGRDERKRREKEERERRRVEKIKTPPGTSAHRRCRGRKIRRPRFISPRFIRRKPFARLFRSPTGPRPSAVCPSVGSWKIFLPLGAYASGRNAFSFSPCPFFFFACAKL